MNEQSIFLAALEITNATQRSDYLDQACAGDTLLRSQVESLIAAHERSGQFLDVPALEQLEGALQGRGRQGETSAEQPAGAEDIDLSFLQPSTAAGSLGRLRHYEIREVVGRGGCGVVLKAFDEKLERLVAIKIMLPELAATSPARKRFLREARATAAIRHENVVSIYAVEEQPLPFLVMEYIEGQTLQQKLDQHGPLDVNEVLRMGQQIASGLQAAHAKGLIHRDIKPGNLLLDNDSGQIKITDFGLARTADDASVTQSGVIAGTPLYMSPEQAQGRDIDHRSDLFSLGSVLYVMCSGRPPFRAPNSIAVLLRVVEEQPRPIQSIIPEVPAWLAAIIARLHAKAPAERLGSAQEVAELLARCQVELNQHGRVDLASDELPAVLAAASASQEPANDIRADRVGLASSAQFASPESSLPTALKPRFGRNRWFTAAAMAIILLTALGLTEATGVTNVRSTIIRLFSAEGTLIVEVDDPGVSVTIDGEELVITGAGAKEIRLKPGQYKVLASKDGKLVRQELVTVTTNGRQVVRVSKEAPPATIGLSQPSVPIVTSAEQRKALEWVLSVGGQLDVVTSGTSRRLKKGDPLPAGPFKVNSVNLEGVEPNSVDDDSIEFLQGMPHIDLLVLRAAPVAVGDAGIAKLATYPGITNARQLSVGAIPMTDEGMVHLRQFRELTFLNMNDLPITAAGLNHLRDVPLTALWLISCRRVDDEGAAAIARLEKLTELRVDFAPLTDAGVAHLATLPELNNLILCDSKQITDVGLEYLAKCQTLRRLVVKRCSVSDDGAKRLAAARPDLWIEWDGGVLQPTSLSADRRIAEYLLSLPGGDRQGVQVYFENRWLTVTKIGDLPVGPFHLTAVSGPPTLDDDGLANFQGCKHLRTLGLTNTRVTAKGLAVLKDCQTLQTLTLASNLFDDTALEHFQGLGLKTLTLKGTKVTEAGVKKLATALPLCKIEWDGGVIEPTPNSASSQPAPSWQPTAEQQAFFDDVAKLTANDQGWAVVKKLKAINPGFDGTAWHRVEGGRVVELKFRTLASDSEVTSIWPVRALADLSILDCGTSLLQKRRKLVDLLPLTGMPLTNLDCRNSLVADLSPLRGMPLTVLDLQQTDVSDLSPLRGMPLIELHINVTKVTDLSPLRGMPLAKLFCVSAPVSSLDPLQGLPLTDIDISRTRVTDLTPLKNSPVNSLSFYLTNISDLSPLQGLPLERLSFGHCPVTDLRPLQDLKLKHLVCEATKIRDLSPLRGMPLELLWCHTNRISDITPLQGIPLKHLRIEFIAGRDAETLRSIPTLEFIDGKRTKEFWQRFDAQQAAAKKFASEVAALPADQRGEAVTEKLKEVNPNGNLRIEGLHGEASETVDLFLGESQHGHDITPLMAYPKLKKLTITWGWSTLDLTALAQSELEDLTCHEQIASRNRIVLEKIKTLKTINGKPAREYFEQFEKRDEPAAAAAATMVPSPALEALRREQISPAALAFAGDGDPEKAPASLVAVLGEPEPIHLHPIAGMAFSGDGRWLVSAATDQTILLREVATCKVARVIRGHNAYITCLAFTPDNQTLVSGDSSGVVKLWPIQEAGEPTTLQFNLKKMRAAVSRDGRFLAAGGADGKVKLWKWNEWDKPVELPVVSQGELSAIAFNADGELLACGWSDKESNDRIALYQTADGTRTQTLPGHKSTVRSLVFSADGKYLASAGDGATQLWDLAVAKPVDTGANALGANAGTVCFTPDSKRLATGPLTFAGNFSVFDLPSRTKVNGTGKRASWASVTSLAFSPDGKILVVGDQGGSTRFYDTTDWQLTKPYWEPGHRCMVEALAVSPDGQTILSRGTDNTLRRWDLDKPGEHRIVLEYDPPQRELAYGPDGKTYATSEAPPMLVFDAATNKQLFTVPLSVYSLAYSPDGKLIAGIADDMVQLVDVQLGKVVHRFPSLKQQAFSLAFSRDGRLLAAAGNQGKIMVWNVATGEEIASWQTAQARRVAFHPDGSYLAIGHTDGTIAFWDATTWEKKRSFYAHQHGVQSLRFTPDGRTLLSSGVDGVIQVRNPDRDRPRAVIPVGSAGHPIRFDLDASGQYLFASGPTPLIHVHRLPLND